MANHGMKCKMLFNFSLEKMRVVKYEKAIPLVFWSSLLCRETLGRTSTGNKPIFNNILARLVLGM